MRLNEFLPYRLSVLAALVSEGLARSYSEQFGIGVPEWRVMATIGEFRSITAKAIGAHAHMGKVKVSRAAAALEGRGLIQRTQNADDMREAFLVLTPAGDDMYRHIVPMALGYAATLRGSLSHEEATTLERLIDKLMARAGEMPPVF
ncbi:MAG: MarR family winged helix-turn-helix transcriptional regulator [Rhizobiaceae bacterium]